MSEQTREELERIRDTEVVTDCGKSRCGCNVSRRMASALLAVLDLHKHKEGLPHCVECGETYCRTVTAIEREMGRGER